MVDYNRQSERSPYNMTVGAYLTLGEGGGGGVVGMGAYSRMGALYLFLPLAWVRFRGGC